MNANVAGTTTQDSPLPKGPRGHQLAPSRFSGVRCTDDGVLFRLGGNATCGANPIDHFAKAIRRAYRLKGPFSRATPSSRTVTPENALCYNCCCRRLAGAHERGTILVRRKGHIRGGIARSLITTVGAAFAAMLPLGSSSVLAAGSHHQSAPALLRDACRATLDASAFRAQGHITQSGVLLSVDLSIGSAGKLLNFTEHGDQTVKIIISGSSTYFEGNRSFWQANSNGGGAASSLAGRWIDMTSDTKDTTSFTKDFTKGALLSSCEGGSFSATYAGRAAVHGVSVTKVHANSRNESDTFYIENSPTPYILRLTGGQSQKTSGNLVFSNYGMQPDAAPPTAAIPISQIQGNTGGTGGTGGTGNTGSSGNTGSNAQQADVVKACEADYKSLEVAVDAYKATVGSYPVPPAPWSASTYRSNFDPLVSSKTKSGPFMHNALDPTHYVIEYDAHGNVWIEPAGSYDAKYNPAHAASDKVCQSILQ